MPLSSFNTIYCNTVAGLEQAYQEGLSRQARIMTDAPALAFAHPDVVHPLKNASKDVDWDAYSAALTKLCLDLHDIVRSNEETAQFGVTTARQAVQLHRVLFRVVGLVEKDFDQPLLFVEPDAGSAMINGWLASPLARLLKVHPDSKVKSYSVSVQAMTDAARPPLRDWFRLTNRYDLVFRALRIWWKRWRPGPGKKRIIIISTNELITETAYHMVGMGYALVEAKAPVPGSEDLNLDDSSILATAELVRAPMKAFLETWVAPSIVDMCLEYFLDAVKRELAKQAWSAEAWEKVLGDQVVDGRTSVLINYPGSSVMVGLTEYCRRRGIPVVCFQHGVTREICGAHDSLVANNENSVSDLFLVFNDAAQKLAESSPLARGRTVAVGMPDHYRDLSRRRSMASQPILYVSTCLYAGNVNLIIGNQSDIDRSFREKRIVEEVLAKLPYRLVYKNYPSKNRYADADPILDIVEQAENIDLFDQPINLKNLIGKHRVIVTSRATSTLAMCIMADRPVVFLNLPDHSPLRPELFDEFADAIFMFQYGAEGELRRMREFLSRPIEEIEEAWQAKAKARADLKRRFFEGPGHGAGRRAAKMIDELVMQSGRPNT